MIKFRIQEFKGETMTKYRVQMWEPCWIWFGRWRNMGSHFDLLAAKIQRDSLVDMAKSIDDDYWEVIE